MHKLIATSLLTGFSIAYAEPTSFSGVYPHLAHTNMEGEVGIGAVVPWAGSLWTNTYGPHLPYGSTDKLRQIDKDWNLTIRPESVGGTPANRMIHPESQQLFIGHHAIDKSGKVRTIDPKKAMPGRITATARHLTDPENKIYHFTMEDGLYEVDVNTLKVTPIIKDPISISRTHLPGYHGKGAYTSNGRLVISNNGEPKQTFPSGCLASWDGKDWSVIARNQFVEVTGPGGLEGNSADEDRLWATGWDQKSVRLFLLDDDKWSKFRMPKSSYTQDAAHGWNTEWPRIREIEEGKFLGHMHGLFFEFPQTFSSSNYGGIKPVGTYTKMPVDYAMFNGKLVMGKDDASKFDNAFVKQAQSNLWIGDYSELSQWGPKSGFGGVWIDDSFDAETTSEPFFTGGFESGTLHLRHKGGYNVRVEIQTDKEGTGNWSTWKTVTIPCLILTKNKPEYETYSGNAHHQDTGYLAVSLKEILPDTQWVRLKPLDATDRASAYFHLSSKYPNQSMDDKFEALAEITTKAPAGTTLQLPEGSEMKLDAYLEGGKLIEVDGKLDAQARATSPTEQKVYSSISIKADKRVGLDKASAYIDFKDANGKQTRLRLPKGHKAFDATVNKVRHIREVVTERTHMNLHGTFYELPRPKPGHFINFWQMKPISSHSKHIHDFCSWRGMLVFSGSSSDNSSEHNLRLDDQHSLFLGEVDDLWKFGKPKGHGGPWLETKVSKGQASDPYLMLGYEQKQIEISHESDKTIRFGVEIDYLGTGDFARYQTFEVKAGETFKHTFPEDFAAHWVRVVAGDATTASAQLSYQ
ncbi:hypothetical protein SAMN02745181_1190 [Rubritalea squalenifaciens DSM 18772]|uniref:Uncharacterized protein n=1 Tax=Rubritalea squalenifaciens DSM 18772 TaxID=1123071 RepID=A0A1M6GJW2_9BACT|nr:hypothetical protein [Rubritalea squalenifaciens]SHJ10211.1 hypothetical protein SAMN02745181_1190 [Rubritalea squalenifaciens DSM 18772]